jgi:rhodanese-related sulfurtransferase
MERKIIIGLFVFGIFLVSGCVNNTVRNLDADGFKELIEEEDVFLLDVHIPEQQHIKGTDAFMPFDSLQDNSELLPKDKDTIIAVYCRSGSMSAKAAQDLVRMGYKNVYNLLGGANEWRKRGYEFE